MARFDKSIDWFELYTADRESVLNTMVGNLCADMDAGYSWFGNSAKKQRAEIQAFKDEYDATLEMFKSMEEDKVQRWCFYELVKRGAIA